MGMELNIQWYPGHMTKARRMIAENTKLVDAVCEIIDARIPISSRNPDLNEIIGDKPRLIILNRADQADPRETKLWTAQLAKEGAVLETDSKSGRGVGGFSSAVRLLLAEKLARYAAKGQTGRYLRVMVVGIPNVGKSSFINRIAKRKAAPASDKPGVTRGKQWINVDASLELLDTPGVLWPKFENQTVAENLAFTGAIKDQVIDTVTLGANLILRLYEYYPKSLEERYKIAAMPGDLVTDDLISDNLTIDYSAASKGFALLEEAAKNRGFLIRGGEYDLDRMASILLDEFRGGRLGRITLERYT